MVEGAMKMDDGEEVKHPRYEYVCDLQQERGFPLIHTHRVYVKQKGLNFSAKWLKYVFAFLIAGSVLVSLVNKGQRFQWVLVVGALIYYLRQRCGVEQEAVVVIPTLGIQLETMYRSKNVKRRFVPFHRILCPVINEAVTPATCYTYLALLLRDDSRLTLTFLHLRPPLSILVPIWTALCSAVGQPPRILLHAAPSSTV